MTALTNEAIKILQEIEAGERSLDLIEDGVIGLEEVKEYLSIKK